MKEIQWINTGRAICMICVFVLHSESRFGIDTFRYSYYFMPFFLTLFFFISGYLFLGNDTINYAKKVKSIFGKMIWPYFIFTSLIWIPKMLKYGKDISLYEYFVDVFGGTASWFIAALIVAQLVVLLVTKIFNIAFTHKYLLLGGILFLFSCYLRQKYPSSFPWFYQLGLLNIIYLFMGASYRRIENKMVKYYTIKNLVLMTLSYFLLMKIDLNYFVFDFWTRASFDFIESVIGIVMMLNLCYLLPKIDVISYMGRNSIVFYFLSGASPTIIGYLFNILHFPHSYSMVLLVSFFSLMIIYPVTYILKRYLPFTIDLFYKK